MKVTVHHVGEDTIATNQVPSVEQGRLLHVPMKNFAKPVSTAPKDPTTPVPKTVALVSTVKKVAQVKDHVREEHQEICHHKHRAEINAFHVHRVTIVHSKILEMIRK